MNSVISGLYVGSLQDASNEVQLNRHKVTHIVSVLLFAKPLFLHRHYLCVRVSDTHDENISQYFPICNEFIHRARLNTTEENNVLIHCYRGYSRSIAIAIAYLMSTANLSFEESYRLLRLARLGARPNVAFQMQLRIFEQSELTSERIKLQRLYGSPESHTLDRLRCRAVLNDTDVVRASQLQFLDERERFGLQSVSGTESYNDDDQESSDEDVEFEDSQCDTCQVEDNERQSEQSQTKQQLQKLLRAMQVLRELRDQKGPTDEEIEAAFDQEALMGNAVLYRPLTTLQADQGQKEKK